MSLETLLQAVYATVGQLCAGGLWYLFLVQCITEPPQPWVLQRCLISYTAAGVAYCRLFCMPVALLQQLVWLCFQGRWSVSQPLKYIPRVTHMLFIRRLYTPLHRVQPNAVCREPLLPPCTGLMIVAVMKSYRKPNGPSLGRCTCNQLLGRQPSSRADEAGRGGHKEPKTRAGNGLKY
jgi:hypothetical protein